MSTSENDKSDWRIVGLTHKFGLAWERAGGTLAELNKLAANPDRLRDLLAVLRGTHVVTRKPKIFPNYGTVRRGVHKSAEAYLAAADLRGIFTMDIVRNACSKIVWSQEEIDDEIVLTSGLDLDILHEYTHEEGDAAAAEFGLYPCEPEAALMLHELMVKKIHSDQLECAYGWPRSSLGNESS